MAKTRFHHKRIKLGVLFLSGILIAQEALLAALVHRATPSRSVENFSKAQFAQPAITLALTQMLHPFRAKSKVAALPRVDPAPVPPTEADFFRGVDDIPNSVLSEVLMEAYKQSVYVPDRFWEYLDALVMESIQTARDIDPRNALLFLPYQRLIDRIIELREKEQSVALVAKDIQDLRVLITQTVHMLSAVIDARLRGAPSAGLHRHRMRVDSLKAATTARYPGLGQFLQRGPAHPGRGGSSTIIGGVWDIASKKVYLPTQSPVVFRAADGQTLSLVRPDESNGKIVIGIPSDLVKWTLGDLLIGLWEFSPVVEMNPREHFRLRQLENDEFQSFFGSANQGRKIFSELQIKPGETVLASESSLAILALLQGAQVVSVVPVKEERLVWASRFQPAEPYFIDRGGSILLIEGDPESSKVRAFLAARGPFDHFLNHHIRQRRTEEP